MRTYGQFIAGEYVDPANGEWIDSVNPYTGETWAKVPRGSNEDVDRAVRTAKEAMADPAWRDMAPSARGNSCVSWVIW